MSTFLCIIYRLHKSVNPKEALETLETLMQEHSLRYSDCLFLLEVAICEYTHEGKFYSNRNKNAIRTLLKRYPALSRLAEERREDNGEGYISGSLAICNYSKTDYSKKGEVDFADIREIVTQVPRPYGVNELELIFEGVGFGQATGDAGSIRPSATGFGSPRGNYILYERSKYGDEKHAYLSFSIEEKHLDKMREFFFAFAKRIPGKYEGTEISTP